MATDTNQTQYQIIQGTFAPDTALTSRPDKVVAEITGGYLYARRWGKDKEGPAKHGLSARLEFTPDPESGYDPFHEDYSAGFLSRGVPSKDGNEPAGGDWEFFQALSKGEGSIPEGEEEEYQGPYLYGALIQRTDFMQFLESLTTCGFTGFTKSLESLYGLKVFLNRVDQKYGSNKPNPATGKVYQGSVLEVGNIIEDPTKGKGNGKAGSAKASTSTTSNSTTTSTSKKSSTPAADEAGEDEFRTRVESLVSAELATTSPQATQMVFKKVLAKLTDANEKRDGLALLKNSEWLNAIERPWTVDGSNLEKVG